MLYETCQSIDFSRTNNSPEEGGAKHHKNYEALKESATNGCELCRLIAAQLLKTREPEITHEQVLYNIWNWYEGPKEVFRGSAIITFYCQNAGYNDGSGWTVYLGIVAEGGSAI
jgi:hypothetical protein